MKNNKITSPIISKIVVASGFLLGHSASAVILLPSTTNFGTGGDGQAGFTADLEDGSQQWTTEAGFVTMTQTGPSGLRNSSLLDQASLVRTEGSSYTFTGVMNWVGGYADDNNRTGLLLFADDSAVAGDAEGLSLQWNIDTGSNLVAIRSGLNGTELNTAAKNGISGAGVFGNTFTYSGNVTFTGGNIDVAFTLSDPDNTTTSVSTTVLAADYPGEFFGFGSRNRTRNDTDPSQVLSFDTLEVAVIPEPSSGFFLLGSLAFWTVLGSRRRN